MNLQKKIVLIFFILFVSQKILAQSINIYGGYPYYFLQLKKYGDYTDVRNKINYIAGLSINKYLKSSKFEIGFAYGTKNYLYNYRDVYSDIQSENVQLNYYFIPISFNQRLFTDSINTISLSLGTVFLKPFGYSKDIILKDGTKNNQDNIPVNYKFGTSVKLGLKYSKSISPKILLFSELYASYKFNIDYYESGSSTQYFDLTDDRFNMGVNIGIEFLLTKRELIYYKKKK